MTRRKLQPGQGKTYITIGLDPEELDLLNRVMKRYHCTQSAGVRMMIRNAAPHTPMTPPFTAHGDTSAHD